MSQPSTFCPEELALLHAIHADPRSDAPRLVYADRLEENGQVDMAEFIRIQCDPPYFKLDTAVDIPKLSVDTWEKSPRVDRAIELLVRIYGNSRYPKARHDFWEEYFRGLPLYEADLNDRHLDEWAEHIVRSVSPLARFRIIVTTANLAAWLQHSIMARVDELRISPVFPDDAMRDEDYTMNSHQDAFGAENIPILAASPVIDRLEELNPQGCRSTSVLTDRSRANIRLCEQLLEPRVRVEYSY